MLVGSLARILLSVRLLGFTGFFRTIIELGGKGLDGPCPKFLGPFRFLMRQKFLDLQALYGSEPRFPTLASVWVLASHVFFI